MDDITRLEQISEDEYVETSLDEEQTTSFFAIHGVVAGGSAYDVFIRLDASVYKGEEDKLNNFLMPEVINLDEKANGLFFSDGSSVNGAGVEDSDQLALNSFTQQGTQYAITTLHQSEEYIEYLKEYAIWRNECEVASMKGEPLPPRWFAEPTLEDLDLEKYTDPNEIMKYVTKNMNITVSDTLVSYEIEYICDWWSQIRITHSIDQVEYADTIENIYLFYKQSAFHEAHAPGDGYNADRIRLTNNDTSKNIKFFVADQKNILNNPVLITRTPGDSIAVFTNLSSYEAYAGSSTDMGTYSSSPNDVVSNYYLFNNGPCFYSGIVLSEADIAGNDDEMKLFVNTLIAAYKASDRVVSRPPRIDIIDPVPVPDPEEEDRPTIIVSPEDIVEGNLVVTFELSRSSSAMDLRVKLDDVEEPEGDWDDIIYPSVYGVLGDPILINNSNKVLSNNTYGLLIPTDILMGTHKLTLQALNEDGNTVTENVWIKFINPPVVTVIKPIAEENSKSKYIYVDIDYNDLVDDGHNMNQAAWLDIIFKVEAAITDVYLRLESGDELLPTDSYEIYEYDGVITSGPLDLGNTHSGNSEYALRLPMSFMTNRNIREFKIIAEDLNGQAGSDTFTLLRRSLFPLD